MPSNVILIVDDNAINLMLVKDLLTLEGYEVLSAANAAEALEILNTTTPNLILMDIQMPGMDGLELTRKLKSNPKYKHIVILAITALAMKHDKEKAIAAGCDGFLAKPIDVDELPTIIANHLKLKQA